MPTKAKTAKTDLGDFQTPVALAREILACIQASPVQWDRVLEPTCGRGYFIRALLESPLPPREIQGLELQPEYVADAQQYYPQVEHVLCHLTVRQQNIFTIDFHKDLTWKTDGRLLVIGNPPWVTSAALGALNSANVPHKQNIKRLSV